MKKQMEKMEVRGEWGEEGVVEQAGESMYEESRGCREMGETNVGVE